MICINNTHTNPYFNIAAEEYLFRKFKEPLFMLWQDEPSVVIGRHQNVYDESDIGFTGKQQIKIVRRFTGGGAVYHDKGNINLTFIRSDGNTDFSFYTKEISQVLSGIGIKTIADRRNSLYIDMKKISGSAQYVRGDKVLFHATLLFSSDLYQLQSALKGKIPHLHESEKASSMNYVRSVKSPVTNIAGHLPVPMTIDEFKKLVFNYFLDLDKAGTIYSFSTDDIININELVHAKYSTTEWNMRAQSYIKDFSRTFC
jgi:lipoate---protein ligase